MIGELQKRIKKKASEISDIDAKIAELQAKKMAHHAVISELENIIRLLPKDGAITSIEKTIRFGSDVYNAREALRREQKPLHIKDLLDAMGVEVTRNRRSSLSSQLSAYAKKEEIFTKAGPNVFGLMDYGPKPLTDDQKDILSAEDHYNWDSPLKSDDEIPF